MSIMDKIKGQGKKTRSIKRMKTVMIDGVEVQVACYDEGPRPATQTMRTKGAQTHDAKITAHMSLEDISNVGKDI